MEFLEKCMRSKRFCIMIYWKKKVDRNALDTVAQGAANSMEKLADEWM